MDSWYVVIGFVSYIWVVGRGGIGFVSYICGRKLGSFRIFGGTVGMGGCRWCGRLGSFRAFGGVGGR